MWLISRLPWLKGKGRAPPSKDADASKEFQLTKRAISPKLALELSQDGLSKQMAFIDAIDSKLATVIGFATTSMTVFGGLLAINSRSVPDVSILLVGSAAIIYILLMIRAIDAFAPRNWLFTPELEVKEPYVSTSDDADNAWAATEFYGMFDSNRLPWNIKAKALRLCLVLVLLQTVLIVSSSVVYLLWPVSGAQTSSQPDPIPAATSLPSSLEVPVVYQGRVLQDHFSTQMFDLD